MISEITERYYSIIKVKSHFECSDATCHASQYLLTEGKYLEIEVSISPIIVHHIDRLWFRIILGIYLLHYISLCRALSIWICRISTDEYECGSVPDQLTRAFSPSAKWLTIGQNVRITNSIIIIYRSHRTSTGENIRLTGVLVLVRDTI